MDPTKLISQLYMSRGMKFPTMWYVRPANAQSDQSLCQSLEYYMTVKLLTEHHLEAVQVCLSVHLSKCHIVGNHMSLLTCV